MYSNWEEPPFENQLCVKDEILNKTFQEYRKDYHNFFYYSQFILCGSEENRQIKIVPWNTTVYVGVFTDKSIVKIFA